MRVSVITPSFGRQRKLSRLVEIFTAQSYEDKELLILDDSAQAAAELASLSRQDSRIRYAHHPTRQSVGAKRNWLIENASGEVIVHFDDDDFYVPEYIDTVLRQLGDYDFFTLSSWYAYSVHDRFLYYWHLPAALRHHYMVQPQKDVEVVRGDGLNNPDRIHSNVWGYGFSYAYRKSVYPSVRFPDINHGEDYGFVQELLAAGYRLRSAPDERGLVLHMVHPTSSSIIFPQYRLPPFMLTALFGERAGRYAAEND